MKKRVLLISLLLVMFTSLVSAYNGYPSFSLSDMLDRIDPATVVLILTFLLSFAIINFALKKSLFSRNYSLATMVGLLLSFGITYGVNRMRWNWEDLLFDLGIPFEWLYILTPLIILIAIIIVWRKYGLPSLLMILGGALLLMGIFRIVFEWLTFIITGAVFILIGFLWWKRRIGRRRYSDPYPHGPSAYPPGRSGRRGRRGRRGSRGERGGQGGQGRSGRRGWGWKRKQGYSDDQLRLDQLAKQGIKDQGKISRRERKNLRR